MIMLENIVKSAVNSRLGRFLLAGAVAATMYACDGKAELMPTTEPTRPVATATFTPPKPAETPYNAAPNPKPSPTAEATKVAPTSTPVATATPRTTLGIEYDERLVKVGYSSDTARRIASLQYNENNVSFADELLLIGQKAGYAKDDFVRKVLPLLEDGRISNDKLVVVRDVDGDGKSNATEVKEGTNVLDRFNRLPASIDSLAVLNDELYAVVGSDSELVHALKVKDYTALFKELRGMPYSEFLRANLGQLGQAINAKVRVEQWGDYKPDIREMNGTYLFGKHKDGKLLVPLDDDSLNRLYPDKEKRDKVLLGIWYVHDTFGGSGLPGTTGYDAQKRNLERLPEIFEAITRAYENPNFNVIEPHRIQLTEHGWAKRAWGDWLLDRSNNNWSNTAATTKEIDDIISSDTEFREKWDMIKFIFGYARSSSTHDGTNWSINLYYGHEGHMISMLPATYKAFGVPIGHASSAPSSGLKVREFVIGGIPHNIMDRIGIELKRYEIVDFGNYGVSLYSPKQPMIKDGAKELVYGSGALRASGLDKGMIVWKTVGSGTQ